MYRINNTFGTDPEVFIYKEDIKTKFGNIPNIIPPAALIDDYGFPWEWLDGKKVLYRGDGFQWSEDGAAIEMQIAPVTTKANFHKIVWNGLHELYRYMKPFDLKIASTPVAHFDLSKYWEGRGEDFRMCVIFGCDPDMFPTIYYEMGLEEDEFVEEIDVSKHSFRYGGAHVHIQAPNRLPRIYFPTWEYAAIVFDFIVGLANTCFPRTDEEIVAEKARLEHYGRPGRIRLQDYDVENDIYGIEYRVMSNSWLCNQAKTYTLLNCMDLASSIITQDFGEAFYREHSDKFVDMYNSIVNFDQESAVKLHNESLGWLNATKILDKNLNSEFQLLE